MGRSSKSRALSGSPGKSVWAHTFLDRKEDLETKRTNIPGIRTFTILSKTHIMVPDYIIKWSDDGCNKTIYKVTQVTGTGKGSTGTMRDLLAMDELTLEAIQAIKLVDPEFTPIEIDDWHGER